MPASSPRFYTRKDIDRIPHVRTLPERDRLAMKAVSAVLPFRVNNYVIEELIDWSNIPDDPIYQLTFPQEGMIDPADLSLMTDLIRAADDDGLRRESEKIQRRIEYDLYFIRERSLRLYLLTLLRTVSAALVGVRR